MTQADVVTHVLGILDDLGIDMSQACPVNRQAKPRRMLDLDSFDPLVLAAAREVDRSLLEWFLSLTPRERLRACTRATRALDRFTRVTTSEEG